MNTKSILTTLTTMITTLVFLTACASPGAKQSPSTTPTDTDDLPGMANPAAVYCENLGYTMETVTRQGGEDADCIFPDGSRCAQWDFLAGRCGQEFSNCQMQGFELEMNGNIGICRFPDSSYCDEYQYFTGECSPGDNPGSVAGEPIQIKDILQARDFLTQYLASQYDLHVTEQWIEQDITPADAAGTYKLRFVSGPMTIVISAEASAPSPTLYTVEEASNVSNGFYWRGTLSFDGALTEEEVRLPGTILGAEDARETVMQHITLAYDLPGYGDWIDQGISQTDADSVVSTFVSGPWVVQVESIPAAPLVASYHVTADHMEEEIRWEGDITYIGEISESSFSK